MELMDFYNLYLKNDRALIKHLYPHIWISGSSTEVYPVTLWEESKQIEIQWDSKDIKTVRNFIPRLEKNPFVEKVYFSKNDGSCPAEVKIFLK